MTHPKIDSASFGKVALFYQQNALHFGYITDIYDNKLQLRDQNGQSYTLIPARLLLISRDFRAQNTEALKSFIQQASAKSQGLEALPLAGESFAEICQNYQVETDLSRFALFLHLKHQPFVYQQKHEKFYRLSEEQARELHSKQNARQARQNWLEKLKSHISGEFELNPEEAKLLLQELRAYLQGHKIEDLDKLLKAHAAAESPEKLAIKLRRRLGEASADPALEASGLPIIFGADSPLAMPDMASFPLAEQSAFCIDDEDSLDFDDAISLQKQESGYRLGIHISLLAMQIKADSPLFGEALERVSSLYLLPETVPMLPPKYSQEVFSLKSGKEMPVLSQYFLFDGNYELQKHEIMLERIRISRNYTYSEVARLAHEAPFATLMQIAGSLKEKRDNYEEKAPYYQVYLKSGKLQIRRIDPQSAGRALIEELMILYNSSIAELCASKNLPLIYRNINQFYDAQQQYSNSTAYLATTAMYHPGIGVGAYLHASSPIRRVVDLINQMQVVSFLQKEELCFSETKLQEMIPHIERQILQIREVLQQSERYWFLKYIEQNELHNPLKAWHRGHVNGKIKAEIMPWGKTLIVVSEAAPQEECFHLIVHKVDWEKKVVVGDLIE